MDNDATAGNSSAAETFDPVSSSAPDQNRPLLPIFLPAEVQVPLGAVTYFWVGFEQDLIHAIFKLVWRRRAEKGAGGNEDIAVEVIHGSVQSRT
jgi:hypothetical protein